jgi:hypothetical protein
MRIITRTASVLAASVLAACSSMGSMMGGSDNGEQVKLSGSNEVPAVSTQASGSGTVTVGSDCSVQAKITVTGMKATAAHIHQGAAGANGKVIVPFTKQGDDTFVAPEGAKLDEQGCADYKAGKTYVNVHSDAHKGGEIRAQLKGAGGRAGA